MCAHLLRSSSEPRGPELQVGRVLVFEKTAVPATECPWTEGRDKWWVVLIPKSMAETPMICFQPCRGIAVLVARVLLNPNVQSPLL